MASETSRGPWLRPMLILTVLGLILVWNFGAIFVGSGPSARPLGFLPPAPPSIKRPWGSEGSSRVPALLWVGAAGYVHGAVRNLARICPCNVTFDLTRLPDVPVVIFDAHRVSLPKVAPRRPLGQVWVFYSQEAPPATAVSLLRGAPWRSAFNWTLTYRRDSDVWSPYGLVTALRPTPPSATGHVTTRAEPDLTSVLASKKRGVAAWMVSNCRTPSRRENYIAELQKYFRVDVWGACGNYSCPRQHPERCEEKIARDYKFYLAFENSLCQDYVSEKFFLRMRSDVISVVRGRARYEDFAPKGTYIDAMEFSGPKELAEFLTALDRDDARFEAMLRKKRQLRVDFETYVYRSGTSYYSHSHYLVKPLCQLCRMAKNPHEHRRQYDDIYAWFIRDKCWSQRNV